MFEFAGHGGDAEEALHGVDEDFDVVEGGAGGFCEVVCCGFRGIAAGGAPGAGSWLGGEFGDGLGDGRGAGAGDGFCLGLGNLKIGLV